MTTRPDLARLVDALVHAFFREIEITGLEHVPADRGGIIVAWHPNGMVDPALIISAFPRRVVFGARDGLFRVPLLGKLMTSLGTVPIRRAVDAENADPAQRRAANRAALEQLAREVAGGSFAALFPEGTSHDDSRPVQMKAGAARLYQLSRELALQSIPGGETPVILPVGLFYDRKNRFRSRALVEFHAPLALPPALARDCGDDEDAARAQAAALTALIEKTLHEVVDATEDWATHDLLQRTRKLLRAERGDTDATLQAETEDFARIRAAYYRLLRSDPAEVARLRRDVTLYDMDLKLLGLEDHELDSSPPLATRAQLVLILSQALLVYLLLPPVLLLGLVVNGPVALLIRGFSFIAAKLKKDQASLKLLAGALLFPLAWIASGVAGYHLHAEIEKHYPLPDIRLLAGVTVGVLAALGGFIALLYIEFARATARSISVRLTRAARLRTLARLRVERRRLALAIRALFAAEKSEPERSAAEAG